MGAKEKQLSDDELLDLPTKQLTDDELLALPTQQLSDEELLSLPTSTTNQDGGIGKAFAHGLSQSTVGLGARALGANVDKSTTEYNPKGFTENVASIAGEFAPDILTLPFGIGVAGFLGRTAAKKAASKALEKAGTRLSKDYLKQKVRVGLAEGAGTELFNTAIKEPSKYVIAKREGKDYEFNPLDVARNVAIGTVAGGVLEPLMSVAGGAAQKVLGVRKIKDADVVEVKKSFDFAKDAAKSSREVYQIKKGLEANQKEFDNIQDKVYAQVYKGIENLNKDIDAVTKRSDKHVEKFDEYATKIETKKEQKSLENEIAHNEASIKYNNEINALVQKHLGAKNMHADLQNQFTNTVQEGLPLIRKELRVLIKKGDPESIKTYDRYVRYAVNNLKKEILKDINYKKYGKEINTILNEISHKEASKRNVLEQINKYGVQALDNLDKRFKKREAKDLKILTKQDQEKEQYGLLLKAMKQSFDSNTGSFDLNLYDKDVLKLINKYDKGLASNLVKLKRLDQNNKMKLLKSQEDWSKKYTSDDAKNLQDLIYGSPKEALDEAELIVSEIPVKYSKGIRPMIRKLETDEDERILRDELYRKSLKAKGLYDENAKIFKQPGKLSVNTWLNNTEFFNKLERDYGVKTGMLVNDSVEASNIAHKYLNDKYLKYDKFLDEVDKSGLSEKVGKMLRGEIKPQTPQEIDYFTRGRALFDEGREDAIKFGANVKYLQNYFPDRTVIPIATSSDSGLRFGIKDKKLAIEQEKTNSMNKALLNNDFVKAARQMHLENSTIPLVKKILPQYIDSVQQLRALGLSSDAKRVEDTFMAGMGFNKDERNKIFADEVMRLNEKDLKQMLVKLSIKEKDLSATVYNELMSSMYKSWLGLSPKTLIVQGMQNGLTTAAEVGYGSLARARKFRMQADGKKLLNEVKDRLYNTSTDYLEKIEGHTNMLDPKSGLGKTKKVIDAVSIPGMAVFRKLDDLNREQAFLAGYLNVKKNGFNSDTMGHLLTGQRRHVLDTLKEKGAEEASREYGIIISHRNNYLYENWDKPEILRGKLGYLLPFTTWGRNQWMRFYGDLTQKDLEGKGLKMAIKRIALPTGMVMAVNALTGYDISSANPLTGLPSIGKLALMPSVMQPLETFAKGEPGRAAQQLMTAVPAGNLIYKMGIKEKTGDPVTDILGFRRRE